MPEAKGERLRELASHQTDQSEQGGVPAEQEDHTRASPLRQEQQGEDEPGLSHEQLVKAFRDLIKQHAQIYLELRSPQERQVWPAEAIVRKELDLFSMSPDKEQSEVVFTLRSAWDALAYDRYEIGSSEEGLAGSALEAYYFSTYRPTNTPTSSQTETPRSRPTIRLTDARQVRILDALTEAVGIPHQRGQTEIEIPEKLQNYTKYKMSQEYQQSWVQAQAMSWKKPFSSKEY